MQLSSRWKDLCLFLSRRTKCKTFKIFTEVKPYLNDGYSLWVTDHSLGGALATVLSSNISIKKSVSSDRLFLFTFGSPRVGNLQFAQGHAMIVPNSYRIIHRKDPIYHVPFCDVPTLSLKIYEKTSYKSLKSQQIEPALNAQCAGSAVPFGELLPNQIKSESKFYSMTTT